MKPTPIVTSVLVTFLFLQASAIAQTYTVTTNKTFTTVVGGSSCTGCTFNITPGVTLTISSGTCEGCTFNKGIVNINGSVSFPNSLTTFNNDTLLINSSTTFWNATFSNDSIAVNASLTTQNNTATITGSRIAASGTNAMTFNAASVTSTSITLSGTSKVTINNAMTLDGSAINLGGSSSFLPTGSPNAIKNGSTLNLSGTSQFKANNALPISGSTIAMSNSAQLSTSNLTVTGSTITATGSNIIKSDNSFDASSSTINLSGSTAVTAPASSTFQNVTMTMDGSANIKFNNDIDFKGSTITMKSSANIKTNTARLESNTSIVVGDGSSTSSAFLQADNSITVTDNSILALASSGNSYKTNVTYYTAGSSSYTIAKTTNGCATFDKTKELACVTLAVANIDLRAQLSNTGAVQLSWSDPSAGAASEYQVERSSDQQEWTSLGKLIAGGYTTGEYQFSDPNAPAGTLSYRIARTDKNGQTLYSNLSTLTITVTSSAIRLYPNPATGRTVFIATPNTSEYIITVYTMTGQVLTQSQLRGQTQYALQLPSQVQPGSALVVRIAGRTAAQTFTLLVR